MKKLKYEKARMGKYDRCVWISSRNWVVSNVSWADPDKPEYPDVAGCVIIFIVENEIGLPYTVEKKFLKKYQKIKQEDIRTAFELTWGSGKFSSKEIWEERKKEREYIKTQIFMHKEK